MVISQYLWNLRVRWWTAGWTYLCTRNSANLLRRTRRSTKDFRFLPIVCGKMNVLLFAKKNSGPGLPCFWGLGQVDKVWLEMIWFYFAHRVPLDKKNSTLSHTEYSQHRSARVAKKIFFFFFICTVSEVMSGIPTLSSTPSRRWKVPDIVTI